jgi:adenylate cyclase
VGEHVLPLDAEARVLLPWRANGWPVLSFATVYANGVLLQGGQPAPLSTAQVRDKVVFIGASATALFDLRVTPVQEVTPGVQAHAALYDAVSTGRAVRRLPAGAEAAILIVLCLLVAMASMMLTRQSAQLLGAMAILLLHLAGAALLFRYKMVWLDVVAPTAGMALAFATGATVNYRMEGRARRQIRNAFAHYLAPSVIEQLVRDPSRLQLGGERREITAFFSDIQGFTTISEQLEPGALVALLNECLGAMTDIVLEEGGTIDKYIGDAIVAMFGAPLSQPDHAERACRAALRCQARLVQLREDWTRRGLPALRVRIGLNTGQALVGNMGSRQRFDFTMMGDTVNLASRLESAAGRYGIPILAGEATFDAAGRQVPMREIDRLRVKGKRQGVRVFEVRDHADAELDPLFANGLEALRSRRWPDARAALGQVLVATPADGPAQVLLDRADLYAQTPPPADWDGTWELTSK